jgi:hypothetical protein
LNETSLRVVAHRAVESTQPLDLSRDRGKVHVDPPQELTFDDVLDIVNPLQHLPIISIAYRELSGDEIKPAMRVMGDIGYGGPIGFLFSCAQVLFEAIFGDDIGGTALALIGGDDAESAAQKAAVASDPARQLASLDASASMLPSTKSGETIAYAAYVQERGSHQ